MCGALITTAAVHTASPSYAETKKTAPSVDGLAALAARVLHITSASATKSSLAERAISPKAHGGSGGATDGIVSPSPAEGRAAGGAGASSDAASSVATISPEKKPVSLMLSKGLIIPEEVTISILQSLYERFRTGLFSFSDYEEVAKQTLELVEGRYSAEWVASLLHSAHQFAEFQTLIEHLPKTNDLAASDDKEKKAITDKERIIISNLVMKMNTSSLDVSNAVTLYCWTLSQIVEQSIPRSEYIQVYRYVTNYVNTRTYGRDWSAEEKTVMMALSASISSKRININESDDRIVITQIEEWLSEIMARLPSSAKEKDRISKNVKKYVLDLRASHFAFIAKFAKDVS